MKKKNQKSFESFDSKNQIKVENVRGGALITSPTVIADIDDQMDLYWTLYDLGAGN